MKLTLLSPEGRRVRVFIDPSLRRSISSVLNGLGPLETVMLQCLCCIHNEEVDNASVFLGKEFFLGERPTEFNAAASPARKMLLQPAEIRVFVNEFLNYLPL